jgi:hypothetical protein
MTIMLRAALAAVSLANIAPAYAGEGQSTLANTRFTEIPGVVAHVPAQPAPTAQNGQSQRSNGTTWLFPPIGQYLPQYPRGGQS